MSHFHVPRRPVRALLLGLAVLAAPALAHTAHHPVPVPNPGAAPLALKATQARVVSVPPTITETSMFVTLANAGTTPVVLTGVRSPLAAHAMLMQTVTDARGVTGMTATPTLTVPARRTLTLSAAGPHVMLMGLKRALKPGETVPVILSDRAGRTLTVRATVWKP
ncbi:MULTISPECIES: copper chaperone PCu(A)C [Deinococcus]|uniref:Copper chaperone PCu(A)C n=1 Tax=Deinococcus rufus TaxID=2136097 RepID=A0ABV7Z587_9DEIO|nr:copper chaperone PCu(A)C [Deinococcus sp. AB2017081]WQE96041.1 copper chaperone PCu(A)C [Deinococcus sp. AB2017081]